MSAEDDSEPVHVFVRIRPEFEEKNNDKSTPSKNSRGHVSMAKTSNNCCAYLDQHNLKIMPPDGAYGSRKNVSAVDDKIYTFDRIFPNDSSQEDVYRSVAEHVLATVRGYNTTIFAYGPTGSGKSYTMTGNKTAPGIIPRAIGDLFRHIENAAAEENDVFFYVRLSYVELYNNTFRNLLENVHKERAASATGSSSKQGVSSTGVNMSMSGFFSELDDGDASVGLGTSFTHGRAKSQSQFDLKMHPGLSHRNEKIEVRESTSAGVFLAGPNLRIPVTSALDAFQLIAKGNKVRAVGTTACNDVSSRSHAILTIHVESRILSTQGGSLASGGGAVKSEMRLGKIHLVDLAGSERLSMSGAEGETRLETQNINLSLTALGDVLSALSRNANVHAQQHKLNNLSTLSQHSASRMDLSMRSDVSGASANSSSSKLPVAVPVPYRNSKLTHLLKDSLGGNSKTVMITTIRVTDNFYQQTAISLMYASRAKKVRNRSLVNRNVLGDTGIHAVSSEIERLKRSLEDRTAEFDRLREAHLQDAEENSALKLRLQEMKVANESERKLLENQVSQVIHSQAGHIASQREKISSLQTALQDELTLSQNRIAEQEKEIKWLKKALDETSQAAQGPYDQMERLQKMVEAWQSQAKTTHAELSTVLKQAEQLKTMNAQLQSKVDEVDNARRLTEEELNEHKLEVEDLNGVLEALRKSKAEIEEQAESTTRAYQDCKSALKEKAEALFDKEFVLKEHAKLISTLEQELKVTRETSASIQSDAEKRAAQLNDRVKELDSEKNELAARLNHAVSTLERSTARVVEDANSKLQQKDSKLKQADETASQLKDEGQHYKKLMEDYRRQLDTREAVHDEAIKELQEHLKVERIDSAQQKAKIQSLEGQAEGYRDKILQLKTRDKETIDSLKSQVNQHEKELREKERALFIMQEQRDAERVTLMTEFERVLEEKTLLHQQELKEAQDGATISDEKMQAIRAAHQADVDYLQSEFQGKEQFLQKRLEETESQVKTMIENEIDSTVRKLEAEHESEIKKLKISHEEELRSALQEAINSANVAAHKQHVDAVEQKHALFQSELDSMRTEFEKQQAADRAAMKRTAEDSQKKHEDQQAELRQKHIKVQEELETKLSSQYENYYDEQVRQRDQKHREELAAAVEAERTKLSSHYESLLEGHKSANESAKDKHQQALKNLEYQRELHLQDALEAERTKFLLEMKESLEEQRAAMGKEFAEQLQEQEKCVREEMEEEHMEERKQVMGQQEQELQALATQQRKEIETLQRESEEQKAHHVRELDLLMTNHKKALADARREAEVLERVAKDGAEREIAQMKEHMAQFNVDHEEKLRESLAEQQKEMIDRQRSESLKLRTDLQSMETRHQAELSAAVQSHVQEMAKQRKLLEDAHTSLVDNLQEELAAAKERCNEVLALSAAKQGQDAAALVELKGRSDEALRRALEDAENRHQAELQSAESMATAEMTKLKAQMDKMRQRHQVEIANKEKELSDEHTRNVAVVKDKHHKELNKMRSQHDSRMNSALSEVAGKGKLDFHRLTQERKEDELKHEENMSKAEQKIRELTATIQRQRVEFEVQNVKLIEDAKNTHALMSAQHEEDEAKLASMRAELENRLEAKHVLTLQTVREEAAAELERQKEVNEAATARRESSHQQELETLRHAHCLEVEQKLDEIEVIQTELSEMRRKFNSSSTENKLLQDELDDIKSQQQFEMERSTKLVSDSSDQARKHAQEILHLKDEQKELEQAALETEETLRKEIQQLKMQNRKLSSEIQDAVDEKEYGVQRQISQLKQQHTMELQREVEAVQARLEEESQALRTARATQAALTAELDKVNTTNAALRAEHSEEVASLNETSSTERQFLRERITRLTQEMESMTSEVQKTSDERAKMLEARVEEERTRGSVKEEHHQSELQALSAQYQTQLQAERVQKANELDELRLSLNMAHMTEMQDLKKQLEDSASQTMEMKDEMSARLNNALAEKDTQLKELQEHMKSHFNSTLTERESQLKNDFERERKRLVDQYEESLQSAAQSHKSELTRRLEEITEAHEKELSAMQRKHSALLRDREDESGSEVVALQRQLNDREEEKREIQRQLVKSEAIREVLKQDTENMRNERQTLREKVHVLELEIIEHGKAKFDARVVAEKDRLENSYETAFTEVRQEVERKVEENKDLQERLDRGEVEIDTLQSKIKATEAAMLQQDAEHQRAMSEKDATYSEDLKRALEEQQEKLQAEYLKVIQEQVETLIKLIQDQSTTANSYDLQDRFLSLVQQLPQSWQQRHGMAPTASQADSPGGGGGGGSPSSSRSINSSNRNAAAITAMVRGGGGGGDSSSSSSQPYPRTPLHILGQAVRREHDNHPSAAGGAGRDSSHASGGGASIDRPEQDLESVRRSRFGGRQSLPWSSPSLRSSPTDQLIAAILDGDVQGIRAVVRSKGDSLKSDFWHDLARSVLPLHRAVSGLHFHGSEKLLVATIEALAQLGADVNATDHAGNSVLHKAIQVCTSKSAAAVVKTLLQRGANPAMKNKDGDTPLHSECKRVRSASVEVIESLVASGADPDSRNLHCNSVTPLALVLLRGAASTTTGVRLIGNGEDMGLGNMGLSPPSNKTVTADGRSIDLDNVSVGSGVTSTRGGGGGVESTAAAADRTRVAGRRVWIRAAEMLLKCGARWDPAWHTPKMCSQLHLLLVAFPPSRDDSATYRKLLKSGMEGGLEPAAEEERGRSALFVLCEQMATVSSDASPDAPRLVHMLLAGRHTGSGMGQSAAAANTAKKLVNTADRTGRTVFDIVERADHSCLSACRLVLKDASQGILNSDGSAYASTQQHHHHHHHPSSSSSSGGRYAAGAGRVGIAGGQHTSSAGSSVSGGDGERAARSHTSSALIARVSQHSSDSHHHHHHSQHQQEYEIESKRRGQSGSSSSGGGGWAPPAPPSASTYSAGAAGAGRERGSGGGGGGGSGYLDYADSPPISLIRNNNSNYNNNDNAGGLNRPSQSQSYFSPSVAPRRGGGGGEGGTSSASGRSSQQHYPHDS